MSIGGVILAAILVCVAATEVRALDHGGTGMIVATDRGHRTVGLVLANGHRLTLLLDSAAKVSDDLGRSITADALQQGDYVREVCTQLSDGRFVARQVVLLRPGWRGIASPEW